MTEPFGNHEPELPRKWVFLRSHHQDQEHWEILLIWHGIHQDPKETIIPTHGGIMEDTFFCLRFGPSKTVRFAQLHQKLISTFMMTN